MMMQQKTHWRENYDEKLAGMDASQLESLGHYLNVNCKYKLLA
jgi:hypothetical protein